MEQVLTSADAPRQLSYGSVVWSIPNSSPCVSKSRSLRVRGKIYIYILAGQKIHRIRIENCDVKQYWFFFLDFSGGGSACRSQGQGPICYFEEWLSIYDIREVISVLLSYE